LLADWVELNSLAKAPSTDDRQPPEGPDQDLGWISLGSGKETPNHGRRDLGWISLRDGKDTNGSNLLDQISLSRGRGRGLPAGQIPEPIVVSPLGAAAAEVEVPID